VVVTAFAKEHMDKDITPMTDPFTADQLKDINKLLTIIREIGGFGCIKIIVEKNEVRFIRLDSASVKYDGGFNDRN